MSWYIWMFVFLLCLGLEIVTPGIFFFLCFSTGAMFAMIFSLLGAGIQTEIIVFSCASLVSILLIRPLLKRYMAKRKIDTNVDSLIGTPAIVIEEIKSNSIGKIKVGGEIWLAVCKEDVEVNKEVIIEAVDGTKLVVKKGNNIEGGF